jgi:hypothetical protein
MSEDKLQVSISLGARAEALLKNDLLQEAFKKLEDDYVAAWKTWRRPTASGCGRRSTCWAR